MGPLPDNMINVVFQSNGDATRPDGVIIGSSGDDTRYNGPIRLTIRCGNIAFCGRALISLQRAASTPGPRRENIYEIFLDNRFHAIPFADFSQFPNLRRINLENVKFIGDQDNNEGIFSGLKNLRYVKFHPEALLPIDAFRSSGLVEVVVPGSELMTRYRGGNVPVRMARDRTYEKVNLEYTFADCQKP